MGETVVDRLRGNAVQITSLLVTGLWLFGLFTGANWWLPALIVGYVVIVPLAEALFGEDEESDDDWTEYVDGVTREDATDERSGDDGGDALETLRERYARGELTDEQFERKLERLVETETLEDVEDRVGDSPPRGRADAGASGRERERER